MTTEQNDKERPPRMRSLVARRYRRKQEEAAACDHDWLHIPILGFKRCLKCRIKVRTD